MKVKDEPAAEEANDTMEGPVDVTLLSNIELSKGFWLYKTQMEIIKDWCILSRVSFLRPKFLVICVL